MFVPDAEAEAEAVEEEIPNGEALGEGAKTPGGSPPNEEWYPPPPPAPPPLSEIEEVAESGRIGEPFAVIPFGNPDPAPDPEKPLNSSDTGIDITLIPPAPPPEEEELLSTELEPRANPNLDLLRLASSNRPGGFPIPTPAPERLLESWEVEEVLTLLSPGGADMPVPGPGTGERAPDLSPACECECCPPCPSRESGSELIENGLNGP